MLMHPAANWRSRARFAEWHVRCMFRRPAIVAFESYGVRFFCPAERRGQAKLAFSFREWYEPELALLQRFVREGDSVVDAGAHYGAYTVVLGKLVGATGRVLAVEPASHAVGILQANVKLNQLTNVEVVHAALGREAGVGVLRLHPDSSRNQIVSAITSSAIERVRIDALDNFVLRRPVRFLKVDVEGMESSVLTGAAGVLNEDRPIVLFEHNPFAAREADQSTVAAWHLLQDLSYRLFRVTYAAIEPMPATPPEAVVNVLALPLGHHRHPSE